MTWLYPVAMSMTALQPAAYGAERLGVDQQRFYAMVREKMLPEGVIVRLGRQVRVNPARLEEWIAAGGQALRGPGGWRHEAA